MSKVKARVKIALIFVVTVLVMLFAVSVYFFRMTALIDRDSTKLCSEKFLRDARIDVREIQDKLETKCTKVRLQSRHGHFIPVKCALADGNYDNKTVILVHGHEMNMVSMYPIANTLLDNGINVVLYDQRAHGDNTAKDVTFGYYEKDDLEDVVNYISGMMKDKKPIGLLGQSMGAATCGFYVGQEHANKNIKFAILDCPYNNMKSVIKVAAKKRGYNDMITDILLKNLNISNKVCLGFWHKDMDVCESIKNTKVPILVYAMDQDKTCPIEMAEDVFNSIKHNNKEIVRFKEGRHIRGFYRENDVYVNKLLNFINKFGK